MDVKWPAWWEIVGALLLILLCIVISAYGQQSSLPPTDELAKAQWNVRQLQASRSQCEENVSTLGMQLDKLQRELLDAKAQLKALTEKPAATPEAGK